MIETGEENAEHWKHHKNSQSRYMEAKHHASKSKSNVKDSRAGSRNKQTLALRERMKELNSVFNENHLRARRDLATATIESKARRQIMLEDYRGQRIRRTQALLDDIEASDPQVISILYEYKLNSVLNHEEEIFKLHENFRDKIEKPNREVAKIEKQRLVRKRLARLLVKMKQSQHNT